MTFVPIEKSEYFKSEYSVFFVYFKMTEISYGVSMFCEHANRINATRAATCWSKHQSAFSIKFHWIFFQAFMNEIRLRFD